MRKMIKDGYADCQIVLSNSVSEDPEDFCFLEKGFLSAAYNSSGLQVFLEDNDINDDIIVLN